MFAMHRQISRIRAERMLDAAQAAAYPHLGKGASEWFNGVLDRAHGVVATASGAMERLNWNGKVVSISAFKRSAAQTWGRAVGR